MDRSPAFIPLTAAATTCGTTPARLRRWARLLRIPLFHPDSSREAMLRQRDLPRLLPILLPLATLALHQAANGAEIDRRFLGR